MKPRIRVSRVVPGWRPAWVATCDGHEPAQLLALGWSWTATLAAANAHARTHHRTDIASHLALRDDHPVERRWETPLPHDLEPPC